MFLRDSFLYITIKHRLTQADQVLYKNFKMKKKKYNTHK